MHACPFSRQLRDASRPCHWQGARPLGTDRLIWLPLTAVARSWMASPDYAFGRHPARMQPPYGREFIASRNAECASPLPVK